MNIVRCIVGLIGLAMIWRSGVDLVYSRTGIGMVFLGGALALLALGSLMRSTGESRNLVTLACLAGGGYFVWRALSGGPVGLAVPDVVQVILFLGVYYSVTAADERGKRILLTGLGIVCVVQLGFAIAQIYQGNTFYVWKENPEKLGSTTGLFGHYNPFAGFLNGSVFFFLSYLCLGKKIAWRVVCGVLVVGLLAGVVMSGSRGGWVSLIMGLVVWMFLLLGYLRKHKSKAFGPVFLLSVIVAVGGIGTSVWAVQKITEKRMEEVSKELERGVDTQVRDGGRLAMQQIAFEIFLDAPVTGQGARSFSYLSLENWDPDELQLWMGNLDFAHNEYLQILADYGAIGFLIVLILLIIHSVSGAYGIVWKDDRSEKSLSIWQLGAVGGLIAILAQCFFSFLLHVPSIICLVALHLGILAGTGEGKNETLNRWTGRLVALAMLAVSIAMVTLGWKFSKSFINRENALGDLSLISTEIGAERVLSQMEKAGDLAWDFAVFERAGREAMGYAMKADESNHPEMARRFRERARTLFGKALKLNPHSPVALCGLPQVEDALGNFEKAEQGHQLAMQRVWSREYHLRPHYFAARSSYTRGYFAYLESERDSSAGYYRQAKERIEKRREILEGFRELEETRQLRVAVDAWLVFFEGERLFEEGERVWKMRPRKPENAERAHALMLEAATRFQKSQKILEPSERRWKMRWDELQKNLELFKLVKIEPAVLTPEEVEAIANPEAVLDSSSENR